MEVDALKVRDCLAERTQVVERHFASVAGTVSSRRPIAFRKVMSCRCSW